MLSLPLESPPNELCLLRISALGDVCHAVAVARTLQDTWPGMQLTWILGKLEHKLIGHIPDIDFVVFDKKGGRAAYSGLRRRFAGKRFDVLLHMQLAFRASLAAAMVPADIKLGFDRERARELQWLFTSHQVAPAERQHVLDGFFCFPQRLGIRDRSMRWDIPLPESALDYARKVIPDEQPTLVISPCSSHELRNWSVERYATVADHAAGYHRMRVLICGGPSELELQYGRRIEGLMREPCRNLVGKDTLLQLLATLQRATVVISPDSGPAHMATTVGTPVIGLYAATRTARTGPYYSRSHCVDRYEAAAQRFLNKPAAEVPWARKIEFPGVMDLVSVDDVTERLDALMADGAPRTPTG
jgi:heptosyltransferase I